MNPVAALFWNRREGRIRALWRLVFQFLLWVALSIMLLLIARKVAPNFAEDTSPQAAHVELVVGFLATLLSVWLVGWGVDKRPLEDFGLHIDRGWWIDLGFGLFLGGFLITLVFLFELVLGWVEITELFVTKSPGAAFPSAILSSIGIFLLISVQEELLFRGYIFTNLAEGFYSERFDPRWALMAATFLSSGIFSLLHLNNAHASTNSTISAFLGGIILTLGYLLTGELAISIGFHCTWNAFQNAVFGFPVSGEAIATASLVKIKQTGPASWVGDAFGPESGLLVMGTVVFGCALIMLWVRLRRHRIGLHTAILRPLNHS